MDHIELVPMGRKEFNGVALMKLKRIPRLINDVHADDVEPSAMVSHASATGSAKEVQ